jgi:ribonuclease HII
VRFSIGIDQMSLAQIRQLIADDGPVDDVHLRQLREDPRSGVRKLWQGYCRRQQARIRAENRLQELTVYERQLRSDGPETVAGLDEAGRGPLAGPLVAAAVVAPWPCCWIGLDDSKVMTAEARERLYQLILSQAPAVGVGVISAARIDTVGIQQANWEAMSQAIAHLPVVPDHVLVDGPWPVPELAIPQTALVGGDSRSISVAAASVVAKVTRDEMMMRLDKEFPRYGFSRHKGYGTPDHLAALRSVGPCRVHRKTFRGVVCEA